LAAKVFGQTAYYDRLIAAYLSRGTSADPFPEAGGLLARKAKELRYGENPHQKAALYGSFLDSFRQIHGKELSYNNILDISSASGLIAEFDAPTLAILKHTNPCGVAASESLLTAWELALETDRQAPFGGIIIVNRELDAATARAIAEIFSEVIIAPNFSAEALEILTQKKNLRLMENRFIPPSQGMDLRSAPGGFLIQESDATHDDPARWKAVTERSPSAEEMRAMEFGWKVVKHVKSNAIVYCGANRTLGVGAGQMSRVDASKIAVWKAGQAGLSLEGSAVASDAFFPFADGVEAAAEAGATAVIQPGGSVRDKEVIAAANQRGLAMVFTGRRHFRH
jgi:phosphoribosylaminoimidazolecarboxamide formyltransferase/IMP cyclohydrolase